MKTTPSLLIAVVAAFAQVSSSAQATATWETSSSYARTIVASDCDFFGQDLARILTPLSNCMEICAENPECSHWIWMNQDANGGACYMKIDETATCGYVVGRFTEKVPAMLLENGLTSDKVVDMLNCINAFRLANGRSPVVAKDLPMAAATAHSKEQASTYTMTHTGVDGSMPWDHTSRLGYPSMIVWENVAAGQSSVVDVMNSWWNSPGHHDNILEPSVVDVGFAKVENSACGYKRFWTQMFGRP